MATVQQSELVEFHEFLGKHLGDPQPHRSPEDLLDEWRVQRGDAGSHEDNVVAIRAALRDMEAGEVGMDADVFFREFNAQIQQRAGK
jgi:hypothetical protein